MAWTSKLPLFACACILVLSACVIYDLNGSSLDFSDSEFVLIVTDSMDGDVTGYDVDSYPADTVAIIHHVPSHEVHYIKVGDVVAYHNGSMLITHRVVSIDTANSVMTLKGDNASTSEIVSFDDVEGVVVGTNHAVGAVFSFVRSNILATVCFIGTILAAVTAFKYYKTIPKEKIQGLRRGTAFAVAMVAVLGIAFAGVGYAYTAATENSGNNIFSEYTVLAQSTYTYCDGKHYTYYSVTNNGSYFIQVGNGAQTGPLKEDADCFLSFSQEKTKSAVVITGGVNAGTYTIDASGVTLSSSDSKFPTSSGVVQDGSGNYRVNDIDSKSGFIVLVDKAVTSSDIPGYTVIEINKAGDVLEASVLKDRTGKITGSWKLWGVGQAGNYTVNGNDSKSGFIVLVDNAVPDLDLQDYTVIELNKQNNNLKADVIKAQSGTIKGSWKPWNEAVTGPLDFIAKDLVYEGVKFDNKTIGNNITVTYDELTRTYTITGTLEYREGACKTAMDKLGMPASDDWGLSFKVKYEKPMTRYFMTDSEALFNGYYGKKIGDTNILKITNVRHNGDDEIKDKIKMTSDTGFGSLTGGWRYILKVTNNSDTSEVQYAMSSGGDWIYYLFEDNKWLERDSLILSGSDDGYNTELFLAGPDANIDSDSLHYASGTSEPIYVGDDANRTSRQLVKEGTITFRYDSTVE
ncbi:MAG: hypothetical protein E7Z65_08765 [Thermoplasmata archaeon]|nr:hypothetical protein [Thermoplasmata archaeon]